MRAYAPVIPLGAAIPARAVGSFAAAAARAVKAFIRARRNRRDAIALAGLDRSMLKDIGITRSDLNDAFSSPFWEDPTLVLRERAIERRLGRVLTSSPSITLIEPATEPGFTRPALNRPARHAV
jgi:uncharacterized protein YjiS (DUF1127 family)